MDDTSKSVIPPAPRELARLKHHAIDTPGRHVLITTRTIVDETEDLPVRLDDERCASRVC